MTKGTISKVLIANRGEISCRAQRACKKLGLPCVAVYTEPDALSLHVLHAAESVCLGTSPKDYLNPERLLEVAKNTGGTCAGGQGERRREGGEGAKGEAGEWGRAGRSPLPGHPCACASVLHTCTPCLSLYCSFSAASCLLEHIHPSNPALLPGAVVHPRTVQAAMPCSQATASSLRTQNSPPCARTTASPLSVPPQVQGGGRGGGRGDRAQLRGRVSDVAQGSCVDALRSGAAL